MRGALRVEMREWRVESGDGGGGAGELTPKGTIDKLMSYDEYVHDAKLKEQRAGMY